VTEASGVRLALPIPHQTPKRVRFSLVSSSDSRGQVNFGTFPEVPRKDLFLICQDINVIKIIIK